MKKSIFAGIALLGLLSTPVFALDQKLEEVNQTTFRAVDANKDGLVSQREVAHFHNLVMISMDGDDDGAISLDEYMYWDAGWASLAATRDRLSEYNAARREVFNAWDTNEDGELSLDEQALGGTQDFLAASDKSDQPLTPEQFSTRLPIIMAMNEALTADGHVTLINTFTVPAGKEAEALEYWDEAAAFMRRQPGYLSTALHQTILSDARYSLINVAKWRSVEAFQAASAALRTKGGIEPVEGVIPNPSLYEVVRSD